MGVNLLVRSECKQQAAQGLGKHAGSLPIHKNQTSGEMISTLYIVEATFAR